MLLHRNLIKLWNCRHYLVRTKNSLSSNEIRQLFLDFFIKHDHKFIRSSPVVPFCDPTLAFVNAGMNQFKSIFLGKIIPPHKRVTNSQKCVRVGGKHNDITIVGKDGYHHTFFEMLGNWSFGDYFKKDACQMAIDFLRDSLKIDTSRLYVTYFGGDQKLNLPADLECAEIWRSLGFQDDRILPFGCSDNFWEMGLTGPCGPCTEIHIDHIPNGVNRSKLVNTGRDDLTELWNLVFIEYNRNINGTITALPQRHVDTGMGMERLTAIIQDKRSNYDTDLFMPILNVISKKSGISPYKGTLEITNENYEIDTAYRIIADHSRMITACLSDGMLPDQNQKLRRVIRTAISISENVFRYDNLLNETIPIVSEILGPTYPEMSRKLNNVLDIIEHEKDIFKSLKENNSKDVKEILINYPQLNEFDFIDYPGFISGFKELQQEKHSFQNGIIPGKFLFKLRDTYGLKNDIIEQIAEIENLQLDFKGLELEFDNIKQKNKKYFSHNENGWKSTDVIINSTLNLPNTDDNFKYNYKYNKESSIYEIPSLNAKVLAIFEDGNCVESVSLSNDNVLGIVTDKSNFYYESGGQESDQGVIVLNTTDDGNQVQFHVKHIEKINNCIIHIGQFSQKVDVKQDHHQLNVNDNVKLLVDNSHRTYNILHHTGTHLLNGAVHSLIQKVIYQVSSSVTSKNLKLELGIIGKKLILDDLVAIENLIRQVIDSSLPVQVSIKTASEFFNMNDVITVPGEIYPEFDLRLLEIQSIENNFISKELCCGTHASSTSELKEFCFINFKQTSRSRYIFTAICGDLARNIINTSKDFTKKINQLEKKFNNDPERFHIIEKELRKLRNDILHNNVTLSYIIKMQCLDKINDLSGNVRELTRSNLKNFVEMEMMNVLQQSPKEKHQFIIHFLDCSSLLDTVPLQKATKLCSDRPILVISLEDGKIKARCCVPKNQVTKNFTATLWLKEFSDVFKGQLSPPKGQNPDEICNMKAKKVLSSIFHDQLELAIKKAQEYALKNL